MQREGENEKTRNEILVIVENQFEIKFVINRQSISEYQAED